MKIYQRLIIGIILIIAGTILIPFRIEQFHPGFAVIIAMLWVLGILAIVYVVKDRREKQ